MYVKFSFIPFIVLAHDSLYLYSKEKSGKSILITPKEIFHPFDFTCNGEFSFNLSYSSNNSINFHINNDELDIIIITNNSCNISQSTAGNGIYSFFFLNDNVYPVSLNYSIRCKCAVMVQSTKSSFGTITIGIFLGISIFMGLFTWIYYKYLKRKEYLITLSQSSTIAL